MGNIKHQHRGTHKNENRKNHTKNQNTHKTNNFIFANLFINYNFNANIVCRVLVTWRFAFANPRASLYSSFEIEIERDVNHPAPNAN